MLERTRPRGRSRRGRRHRRPLGVRQVDAARADRGLREPSPGAVAVGGRDRRRASGSTRCAYMPQRDLLLPWLAGDRQRRARAAEPRRLDAPRPAHARGAAASSASASRASSDADRLSSPAACASGSPSCARCWPASPCCCSTSRSPRSTRSPGRRCRSGSRGALGRRAAHGPARHPRRRGGALSLPTGSLVLSPRPAAWRIDRARRARRAGPTAAAAVDRRRRSSPAASGALRGAARRRRDDGRWLPAARGRDRRRCSAPGSSPRAGT